MIARLLLLAVFACSIPAAAQLSVEKRADLTKPVVLEPGQAAIVVGFRRPDPMSAGKSGAMAFVRYDLVKREMIARPKDAKKTGDTTTYWVEARSGDRKLPLDHAVMIVSAGDYVLFSGVAGPTAQLTTTFCLSAPVFTVKAGETVYFGDVTPYMSVKLVDGSRTMAMAYSSHPDDARAAIAAQPALAAGFRVAELHNRASYSCAAQAMSAYAVPGAPDLEPPVPAAPAP